MEASPLSQFKRITIPVDNSWEALENRAMAALVRMWRERKRRKLTEMGTTERQGIDQNRLTRSKWGARVES